MDSAAMGAGISLAFGSVVCAWLFSLPWRVFFKFVRV